MCGYLIHSNLEQGYYLVDILNNKLKFLSDIHVHTDDLKEILKLVFRNGYEDRPIDPYVINSLYSLGYAIA